MSGYWVKIPGGSRVDPHPAYSHPGITYNWWAYISNEEIWALYPNGPNKPDHVPSKYSIARERAAMLLKPWGLDLKEILLPPIDEWKDELIIEI